MNKLIIAAAVICTAAFTQAASIMWNSGVLGIPSDAKGTITTDTKAEGAKAYIIALGAEEYAGYAAKTYSEASAAIWEKYSGNLGTSAGTVGATGMFVWNQTGVTDKSGEHPSAIIFTYQDATGNDWYIANIANPNVTGAGMVTAPALGTIFGGTAGGNITAWTAAAVPAPTSGLLLLLGVAGLALRRRRA